MQPNPPGVIVCSTKVLMVAAVNFNYISQNGMCVIVRFTCSYNIALFTPWEEKNHNEESYMYKLWKLLKKTPANLWDTYIHHDTLAGILPLFCTASDKAV